MEYKAGLYLCATPIGNLGDITARVEETLRRADVIFCEDTRNSAALLIALGIKKRLESCHEHNEMQRCADIVERIRGGAVVAYISDAGMPAISDPGERLVRACIDAGVHFEVLPGASASLTAAILSGLPTSRIYFMGFLPRSGVERAEAIAEIRRVTATTVIYESPYRVAETLAELCAALGDRQAAVCREITKLFEETRRGDLLALTEQARRDPPKGECVIVIGGAGENTDGGAGLEELLTDLLRSGMSVKDAAKRAAIVLDVPKGEAYTAANRIKEELNDRS